MCTWLCGWPHEAVEIILILFCIINFENATIIVKHHKYKCCIFNPPVSRIFLHFGCPTGEGGKITPRHVYLKFYGIYEKNFNSYSHVFEVKLFNGANSYIAGSRVQPEIDMESDKQEIIVSRATGQLGK